MVATFLTREGYQKFQEELDWLIDVRRPEVAMRLSQAVEGSDDDDTAEYEAAKDEQGLIEARIKKLEIMLASACILDEQPKQVDRVDVVITSPYRKRQRTETYLLVGPAEADPLKGRIRMNRRWARPCLGARWGMWPG